MKQRLISAGIGLGVFFVVLFFYNTVVFDIAIALIALLIVHELLLATKVTQNVPLTIVTLLMSTIPFWFLSSEKLQLKTAFEMHAPSLYLVAVSIMFLTLLSCHEKLMFEKIATAFFVGMIVPFAMTMFVQIRNQFSLEKGIYYTLLIFACAWGADSGAYFAGRFFGKKKLAPKISPNKTVEGVYGGVASCIMFVAAITAIYFFYEQHNGVTIEVHLLYLLLLSLIGTFVGILGDLTASVIKRQTGIKDFGSIMPGHGGALDRFDSVLFVAPTLFVLYQLFPI